MKSVDGEAGKEAFGEIRLQRSLWSNAKFLGILNIDNFFLA